MTEQPVESEMAQREIVAMSQSMPRLAAVRAGTIAIDLARLPTQTSHVKNIERLIAAPVPDLELLEQELLAQCRELTQAKGHTNSATQQSMLSEHSNRCIDAAIECRRASELRGAVSTE